MSNVIIFIPSSLYERRSGILFGVAKKCSEVNNFYIFRVGSSEENCKIIKYEEEVLGYYGENKEQCKHYKAVKGDKNWLSLTLKNREFFINELVSDRQSIPIQQMDRIIAVVYNYDKFVKSELIFESQTDSGCLYIDYFKTLAYYTKENTREQKKNRIVTYFSEAVNCILTCIMHVVHLLLMVVVFAHPALKYSSLGLQVQSFFENVSWALASITSDKKITLKVGNFLVAAIIDISSGVLLLYFFLPLMKASPPSVYLLDTAEVVVNTLRDLLTWIMGIPAGLKLNFAFNSMLGKFFLYHINLWWTFLVVAKPLLELMIHIFLYFGCLGLTFQAAILADLLAIASFHVYCIYVYAARLYNLQVSGLVALWRLFLGRKYNPLRGRVDSCKYSADQLFIGTLAFTILLFLLPTTFVYYVVFATLRILMVGLSGLLIRIRFLLQTIPLYATCLWLFNSDSLTKSVKLTVKCKTELGPLIIAASPTAVSLWTTIQICIPSPVKSPSKVEWGTLVKHVVTGHLIYPV